MFWDLKKKIPSPIYRKLFWLFLSLGYILLITYLEYKYPSIFSSYAYADDGSASGGGSDNDDFSESSEDEVGFGEDLSEISDRGLTVRRQAAADLLEEAERRNDSDGISDYEGELSRIEDEIRTRWEQERAESEQVALAQQEQERAAIAEQEQRRAEFEQARAEQEQRRAEIEQEEIRSVKKRKQSEDIEEGRAEKKRK